MTQVLTPAPVVSTLSAVICDDRPHVRQALGAQLAAAGGHLQVMGVVPDGPALLGILEVAADGNGTGPELVFVGVHCASGTGMDAIRLVRSTSRSVTVIAFGAARDAAVLADAVRAGAGGVLLWDLFRLPSGPAAVSAELRPVRWTPAGGMSAGIPRQPLTEREIHVLREISKGRSNGEIGRQLQLSQDSVKNTAHRMFTKLGARDRAHAVAIALRGGLLG